MQWSDLLMRTKKIPTAVATVIVPFLFDSHASYVITHTKNPRFESEYAIKLKYRTLSYGKLHNIEGLKIYI